MYNNNKIKDEIKNLPVKMSIMFQMSIITHIQNGAITQAIPEQDI